MVPDREKCSSRCAPAIEGEREREKGRVTPDSADGKEEPDHRLSEGTDGRPGAPKRSTTVSISRRPTKRFPADHAARLSERKPFAADLDCSRLLASRHFISHSLLICQD